MQTLPNIHGPSSRTLPDLADSLVVPGSRQIARVVCTGSQATVSFSDIPQNYADLRITFSARDTTADTSSSFFYVKMNGDGTSGNYTSSGRLAQINQVISLTNVAATANGAWCGTAANNSNTAGIAAVGEIVIPAYSDPFFKRFISLYGANTGTNGTINFFSSGEWKSADGITSLTFTAGGTAFVDNSVFTLYGLGSSS